MKKFSIVLFIAGIVIFCLMLFSKATEQQESSASPPIAISDKILKLWVPYDPKKPDEVNNIDNKFIFIDDVDLKEIQKSKKPIKISAGKPPVNYQLSSVNFFSNIKDDYVNITGVYNIEKLDNEWSLVPIISDRVGVSSAYLDKKPAFLTTFSSGQDLSKFQNASSISSGNYFLAIRDKGNHQLKINFSTQISKDPSVNTKSFSFLLPNLPIVNLSCLVNQKNLEYYVTNAISVTSKTVAEGTKMFATLPPSSIVEVKWNPKSINVSKSSIKSDLTPSITATTYSKIEVGKGSLIGKVDVDLDIRHSPISHFDFYVPNNVEIDSVKVTNNIELINAAPEVKNNILPVDLTTAVEGKLQLTLNYRKNFEGPSFITKIPAITLLNKDIDREIGYVGIVETTNIESSIKDADQSKNYQEIDSTELSGPLTGTKASIAFKYQKNKDKINQPPYDITMSVVRHQDVSVYEANIKSTEITSVLNEDGQMFTKAILQITNTRKQFLTIKLPVRSSIWSVYVDNRSVKPAIKDINNNLYSIPLAKSVSSDNGGKTFPVEIVYYTDNNFFLPLWTLGIANLKSIAPELATNNITWKLYLPNKIAFWPIEIFSNLQKQKYETSYPYARDEKGYNCSKPGALNYLKQAESEAPQALLPEEISKDESQQRIDDARIKSKEEVREQVPGPLSSIVETKRQAPDYFTTQQKALFKSKKSGKLPVYINLPQVGNTNSFYQISFQANKFPSIFYVFINQDLLGYLLLAVVAYLCYKLVLPVSKRNYKSFRFIIPTSILTIILYSLIGLKIIGILLLIGVYLAYRLSFKMKSKHKKTVIIAITAFIILILTFFIVIKLHLFDFCFGVIVFLIILGLFIAAVIAIFRVLKYLWRLKFKPEKEGITTSNEGNFAEKEGQNNE